MTYVNKNLDMSHIRDELFSMSDQKYKAFSEKLTPTVSPDRIIGIRIPDLRAYAKRLHREGHAASLFDSAPHKYFEEDNLHAFLIEHIKDFDACIRELERFLPHIDNWASCDSLRPKALTKDKELLLRKIKVWLASPHEYTVRFAIECLMLYYLDGAFTPEIHKLVAGVDREEYYIRMMVAWYFATSLAKRWEDTIEYITTERLEPWVHAKTIQKACESYRLTNDQKQYLRRYR
jgi:3-methyladenine DNA glycosylase AlkD